MLEKDLNIYDVWKLPNGNLFIKICDEFSIAIGPKGYHSPLPHELKQGLYVKSNNITPVKKVGCIIFRNM